MSDWKFVYTLHEYTKLPDGTRIMYGKARDSVELHYGNQMNPSPEDRKRYKDNYHIVDENKKVASIRESLFTRFDTVRYLDPLGLIKVREKPIGDERSDDEKAIADSILG